MKKVVITGGPHSGKTTLIERLREEGFPVVEEAAIKVIDELIKEFGDREAAIAWRKANVLPVQLRISEKVLQLESEAESRAGNSDYLFYDRGRLDGIAYCRFRNMEVPVRLTQIANHGRYDVIFVLDTLSGFKERAETGRISKYEDSKRLRDLIYDVYTEHGYAPIFVKEMPVDDRLKFIKTKI